ncbi:hypothetical protein, variant [Puccinia triticina 1-1 BBBD Race 1]|uniref:Uncharacterized protein n=1 Tax=Puccinia triticina (isolate 1-1 / race 1 (BBBD)) TaxID=630390 RepID=A0A0C4ERZ9_PUCT1|nr:hypothetical protein, variant [Puccinia triticina 1-1 BBBD Race 1]
MSRFGLDLFARENPPPGYFTSSEYQRIHLSGEPTKDLPPQIIVCNTGFKLLCPKNGNQCRAQWTPVNSSMAHGNFDVLITARPTPLAEFQEKIASACDEQFDNAGDLIRNALKKGSPRIVWKLLMHAKVAPEFAKSKNHTINNAPSFDRWMDAIIKLGKDRTKVLLLIEMINPEINLKKSKAVVEVKNHIMTVEAAQQASLTRPALDHPANVITADRFSPINIQMNLIYSTHPPNSKYHKKFPVFIHATDLNQFIPLTTAIVQQWATDLVNVVAGISIYSPPRGLKYEVLSLKRRKLVHTSEPCEQSQSVDSADSEVITPDPQVLLDYIEFIKIRPSKRDKVLAILNEKDITHPKFFKSKQITNKKMLQWGLSNGIIYQLKENVSKFEKHLALQ